MHILLHVLNTNLQHDVMQPHGFDCDFNLWEVKYMLLVWDICISCLDAQDSKPHRAHRRSSKEHFQFLHQKEEGRHSIDLSGHWHNCQWFLILKCDFTMKEFLRFYCLKYKNLLLFFLSFMKCKWKSKGFDLDCDLTTDAKHKVEVILWELWWLSFQTFRGHIIDQNYKFLCTTLCNCTEMKGRFMCN